MKNKVTFVGANKVFFIFAVVFLISQLVLGFLTAIYGEDFIKDNVYSILLINQYIIILIPILGYVLIKKLDIRKVFRLNGPGIVPALLIVLMSLPAYMGALMLNTIVMFFIQLLGEIPSQPLPVPQNITELGIGILVIAVSPALCEELLHRGVLLSAYENRGSLRGLAISSILFGVFHFDVNNLAGPIFLGFLIGYVVLKTNSIFSGMLAHFLNNSIALILQYISPESASNGEIQISAGDLVSVIFIGAVSILILAVLLILFRRATAGRYTFKPPISSVKNDIISVISHWPIIFILVMYLGLTLLYLLAIFIAGMAL